MTVVMTYRYHYNTIYGDDDDEFKLSEVETARS